MSIVILSDIFDPSKGSEFQVAQKAIRASVKFTAKNITLWCLKRANNEQHINDWMHLNGFEKRVKVRLFEMKYANSNGSHRWRIYFLFDLIRLYIECVKSLSKNDIFWKCGQVNFLFNIFFLFIPCRRIIGPISGYEIPPIIQILKSGDFPLFFKYSLYSILIIFGRILTRLALLLSTSNNLYVLFATNIDAKCFFKSTIISKIKYSIYTEIDIQGILFETEFVIKNNENQLNIPSDSKILLWSGGLIRRKNPFFGILVFEKYLNFHKLDSVLIIGNGPQLGLLKSKINNFSKNISKRIFINSYMDRKSFFNILNNVDAVFITSWREVNSSFAFEALALNIPILSTNISGMSNSIGKCGLTYSMSLSNKPMPVCIYLERLISDANSGNGRRYLYDLANYEDMVIKNVLSSFL